MPCDVLIPASVSGVITAENAPELQCKVLPGPYTAACTGGILAQLSSAI